MDLIPNYRTGRVMLEFTLHACKNKMGCGLGSLGLRDDICAQCLQSFLVGVKQKYYTLFAYCRNRLRPQAVSWTMTDRARLFRGTVAMFVQESSFLPLGPGISNVKGT